MTTAKFSPLVETLPEIADEIYCEASQLIGAGLGGCEVRIGDRIFLYGPCRQRVSRYYPIDMTLLGERGPVNEKPTNDNTPPKNLPALAAEPSSKIIKNTAAQNVPWRVRQKYMTYATKQQPALLDRSGLNRGTLKVWQSQNEPSPAQENAPKPGRSFRKQLEFALLALYLAA